MSEIVLPSEILTPAELDVDNQHVQSLIASGVGIFLSIDNLTTVTNVFNNTGGVASDITANELGEQFNEYRLGADISSLSAQAQEDINANPYQLFKIHEVVLIPVSEFTVGADPQWDYPNIVSGFEAVKNSGNTQRLILNDLEVLTSNYWLRNVGAGTHIEMVAASGREWNGIVGEGVGLIEGAGGNLISNLTKEQITLKGLEWRGFAGGYTVESCFLQAQGGFSAKNSLIVSSYVLGGVRTFNNQTFSANNSIIVGRFRNTSGAANMTVNNCILYGAIDSSAVNAFHGNNNVIASSGEVGTAPIKSVDFTDAFVDADSTYLNSIQLTGRDFRINPNFAAENLIGKGWNNSDIVKWAYYAEAQIGIEQVLSTVPIQWPQYITSIKAQTNQLLNASELEQIIELNANKAVIEQSFSAESIEQIIEVSTTQATQEQSFSAELIEQYLYIQPIELDVSQQFTTQTIEQLTLIESVKLNAGAVYSLNPIEQYTYISSVKVDLLSVYSCKPIEYSFYSNDIKVSQAQQFTAQAIDYLMQVSTSKHHQALNFSTVAIEQIFIISAAQVYVGALPELEEIDWDNVVLYSTTPQYKLISTTPHYILTRG